ncbi:MAG: excinuclease ABC subunit UvrC [Microbacteriaceae bacterium]|nr:excinuclease ABC subunit UvrC [Microbacteriaceae bacterium]
MVDNRSAFKPAAGEIPISPGVYRFSDRQGRVLYIGKAKNLRARLQNYFQPWHTLLPRTRKMLSLATALDWTIVNSDTEALILEHTWVTGYKPPFNVQLKDDKSYPYLAVTLGSDAPRLIITRDEKIKGAKYFGPYPKVWALKQTVQLLLQAFPIRTCNDPDYRRAMQSGRPCLPGQIGRCKGPCSFTVTVAEHRARVEELVYFLQHFDDQLVSNLEKQMQQAAVAEEYEKAAIFRDKMQAVQAVLESNAVVLPRDVNTDVFGLYADELAASVQQFIVRGGRIRGERSWLIDVNGDDTAGTLLEQVLQTAYDSAEPPPQILTTELPENATALQEVLRQKRPRGGTVHISVPVRGDKKRLLDTARMNAGEQLLRYKQKRSADITARTDALAELQRELNLPEPPLRIECIDASHLQGTNVVASLVVFEDGLPAKGAYRKYKIAYTTDDTHSINQVVTRRAKQLNELREQNNAPSGRYRERPQLLIVDGGPLQVAAALRALKEAKITDIPLVGLAKRLEELWLPNNPVPVMLERNSEALFLVQRIRDEAHRFAITFQRHQRKKSLRSTLEEIPGLGPARVKLLLQKFGSLKRIAAASTDEIAALPGISDNLAASIKTALNPEKTSDTAGEHE